MVVTLDDVSRNFGRTRALKFVSTQFEPSELVAVLGLNGAGKSTMLRILAGEIATSSGKLIIDGTPFRRDNLDVRREMLFLPDDPYLVGETPLRTLSLYLNHYGRKEREGVAERAVELLEEFEVVDKATSNWGELSRGQSYKAAFVVMCALRPKLWILDEPFASGMDAKGIRLFREHARRAVENGATVIYSTQLVDLAEDFSTRVCVLHEGELRAAIKPTELRSRAADDEVFAQLMGELADRDTE